MIENTKPSLTIGDLIKNKDYDYVEYRITIPVLYYGVDDIFAGEFKTKNGKIISLDGDGYSLDQKIVSYEEWDDPENGIKNGLTIIV